MAALVIVSVIVFYIICVVFACNSENKKYNRYNPIFVDLKEKTYDIRLATQQDIFEIWMLSRQLSNDSFHKYNGILEKYKYNIENNPNYFLWVAEDEDKKIAATCMMYIQHKITNNSVAHINDLVVQYSHRNNGLGRMMLETAIATAKRQGCYNIVLSCNEKQTEYYEKFGFSKHSYVMKLEVKSHKQEYKQEYKYDYYKNCENYKYNHYIQQVKIKKKDEKGL